MLSGLLSAIMVLSAAVTPATAFASEMNPEEELKAYVEALPELDQVKDQLDPEEIVTAKDLEVDFDAEIDLKKDFTNLEIPDKEKVNVKFYEAKDSDQAEFSTGKTGTYRAVYYVEPRNEQHPVYRISRNITVKEPVTEAQISADDNGGAEDDASDGESEDADSEPALEAAPESAAEVLETVSPETVAETEEPHIVYEFTEEAYEPETAAAETGTAPVETESASGEETAQSETEAVEETETEAETETAESETETETENKDGFQVNITKGEELGISLDHEDGVYQAGDTVSVSTDIPAGTPTAVAALKPESIEKENTEDLLYSEVSYNASADTFTFEMPAEDIALEVQMDAVLGTMMLAAASSEDSWDDATEIEANKYYYYSDGTLHPFNSVMGSGGNDSYKYVRYKVGGKTYTVNAYCMQHSMSAPPSGTTYTKMIDLEEGGDDKYLRKALFYGYGGPGWGDTFNGYNIQSIMKKYGCGSETRAMQHYLVDYLYDGESGFGGSLSTTAKNMLKEIKAALKEMPDPSAIELKPGLSTTATGKDTETFTWKANEAFVITVHLEDGVSLVNETTGKTGTGNVKVKGGEKFHLTATTDNISNLKGKYDITCNYPMNFHGMLLKLQNSQDIGFGYYTDGDDIQLTVDWPETATLEIVKEDGSTHAKLTGAVYGVYSDEACTKLITKMPATDSKGASKVEFNVTGSKVYLKELTAPKGYKISAKATGVSVSAGKTSTATLPDEEIKGKLTVYKEGQILTGATSDNNGTTFKYETAKLAGAKYSVTAGADIVSAAGTVVYKKGAPVANLTTDKNGEAVLDNLTLGTYVITETGAPANYVNKGESKTVTLSEGSNSADAVIGTATFNNDRQKAKVTVVKQDDTTENPLPGGIYGLYAGADIKAADGKVVVKKDTFIEKVTTGADGSAVYKADLPLNNSYYVKEMQAPKNYYRNQNDVFPFTFSYTNEKQAEVAFSHTFKNERVDARIDLVKVDAETGEPQGDAKLGKATYGLYARENIVHPDGKTGVLYKAGAQVATLTTDDDGKAFIEDLYLGKYFIKELIPSEGYLLDEKEYDLDCAYEGDLVKTVKKTATSKEQVIKQPFQVIKAANNGKTDADLLKGVGFSAYLISSLKTKKDGRYDFKDAKPIVLTADGKTEMFTDEKGYAVSIPIPYGKYIVRETTTPHNFTPVDDFAVTISENHPKEPQQWRVLLDDEFEAKLKIIKKDDETKKPVLLPKTEFKVYDLDNKKYVEQVTTYPSTVTHKSYFTDENGYLILPNNLKIGHYRIEEVTAPNGYVLNHNAFEVLVDSNTAYQMDQTSGDAIIEVTMENQPVKGRLTIKKSGEVLASFDKDFGYEMTTLADAEFAVYAAEDIYTPDWQRDENGNRIVIHAKDALVATVKTDEKGSAVVEDLPLGSYRIEETKAPFGFVLNKEPQTVTFTYADQETPVIEQTAEFTNDRQKVEISVEKQDVETGKKLEGVVFGLYAASAIGSADHEKVLVEADTLLEEATSDANGLAAFTLDLPLGQYYVKEHKAPAGYVSSDEVLTFDAGYQGQDVPVVQLTAVKKNEPTTFEFTKSDITTGTELEGAVLTILTRSGDVIERWTSVKNEPHVVKCLTAGESYVLREEFAPYGYLRATDVVFTVEDTAKIQKVEMKDEVPTALLIINKKGEFLDKVSLLDNAKGTVEHMFEYISGNLTPVTFEVYAAEDIKAADGIAPDYYKKDDLIGTITTDDTGIAKLGDLPVGKYYVVEKETAYGYVLDNAPRFVDLSYRDQDTPIVVYDEKWQNARQKVSVSLLKKEKGTETPLKGAIFGLYTAEDIKSKDGKVLIEKDTLIEQKTTDADGQIFFIADLPIDGKYYLTEIFSPNGYVNAGEKKEFTFTYEGSDKDLLSYSFTFVNEPTTVELSKTDITNGKELPGAHLRVIDENANLIDEWVSEEKPHIIRKLVVGREYELIETKPADGYATAESVSFKIENTGEVQKVKMEDDVTKVRLSKSDITDGKPVIGAKLSIIDEAGKVVETWTTTEEEHYIEKLPIGKYTLREETAPAGYLVAEDVLFTVKDTGVEQKVEMKDDYTKVEITKSDITDGKPVIGAKLTIFDQDGKEVESWVTEERPHYIEKLPVGEYTLREVTAPDGYLRAEDVKFTVKDTGEIQKVAMKDDYTKVEISKQDITNSKEIPGAKLTIFDKDGKEVESWVSEDKPHYIEKLPVGEYTLREVTAPDGYEVAEDVKFTVAETGVIQTVVMKDAPKKQPETTPTTEKPTTPDNPTNPTNPSTPTTSTETPKETPTTPKTGDDRNPLIWLLLLGIGGCMAGAAWYLRKKDEKDQNQD